MNNLKINVEDVKRFFGAVWPMQEVGYLAASTKSNGRLVTKFFGHPVNVDLLCGAVERWSSQDVWVCQGCLSKRPERGRGTAEDVIAIPGLWFDLDCREGHHNKGRLPSKDDALAILQEIPFKPSMLIWSGGGYQVYWLFKEPLADVEQFKKLSERFHKKILSILKSKGFDGDNTCDPVRLLRLPGTWNHKGDPVQVKILEVNDFRYEPDDFEDFIIDVEEPQKEQPAGPGGGSIESLPFSIKQLIKNGAPKGQRSEAIGSVLTAMVKAQVPEDAIISVFDKETIGEKFREKGSGRVKWLRDDISRCREFVGQSQSVTWEDPVLLDDASLPEMEPVRGIIGEFSEAVARSTETPLELATGLIIATVATACQGRFMIQVKRDHSEPVNVWIVVALDSGNRKSSVLIVVTHPLMSWESQKCLDMEDEIKKAASKRMSQDARLKSLRAKYGKAKAVDLEAIEDEIQSLESELVDVPVAPRVWCDDVTTEHLGTLMSVHNERMSVMSAEGGIFDTIAGRYSNGIPNMDLYLKGHSGDPVRVDRGSRESNYLKRPALTLCLSPQPDVLKSMGNLPGFRGRGFNARCGFLLPKSKLGFRSLETVSVSQDIRDRYERVIHELLDIEPGSNEYGDPVPYVLKLSRSAFQEWMEFSKVVEVGLREGGRFEYITDWGGKLPGFAIRLAGLLHCVEDPYQPWVRDISLDTMRQALELASIFSSHALAVFNLMGADKCLEGAKKVWRWIERGRFQSFSKRDCCQALRGSFQRVQDLEPCLDVLEERFYISATKQQTGGRPTVLYSVNPSLVEGWS